MSLIFPLGIINSVQENEIASVAGNSDSICRFVQSDTAHKAAQYLTALSNIEKIGWNNAPV